MAAPYIHPQALVETDEIGEDTRIWAFVHVLKGASIGSGCNVCDHCYIEYGVRIGNHVTVKSGIYIWEGVHIDDHVFLGPNVVFTNDLRPRSKQYVTTVKTYIKEGASIGANSTVLAGVTIGKYAMSGIGSVITRNVPDYALVYGNPAKFKAWIDEEGNKLTQKDKGIWTNKSGTEYIETPNGLARK